MIPFSLSKNEITDILRTRRRIFHSAAIFSAFINLLMLIPSLYMLQVYDRVLPSSNIMTLFMLTLITIGLFIMMGALDYVRSMMVIRLSNYFDMQLNERVYTAAHQKRVKEPQFSAGQALIDLTTIRQFLTGNALFAFFDIFWFPIYLFVIFLFNIWLGIFALFGVFILILLAIFNEIQSKYPLKKANLASRQSHQLASENLSNPDVITAMGMVPQLRQRWLNLHLHFLDFQRIASEKAALILITSKTFRMMLQSLVLGLGALLVLDQQITPGMMIAGSILMGRTLSPIEQLISAWKGFSAAKLAWQRLITLLNDTPKHDSKITLPAPKGVVNAHKIVVNFPQNPQKIVLKEMSFALSPGNVLGIIGSSASGKSSLLRALAGILPVSSGSIRLDGADIFAWDKTELGPHIGYLPQNIALFSGTIAENIARFNALDSQKIIAAAQKASVHELILGLEKGYETVIGHDGIGLSGGQKQRIGLARALYGDPTLILLDEPNSNLDDEGEMALKKTIETLKAQQKTVIFITHRRNLLEKTTHLLFLMQGEMKAFGPTEKVLAALTPSQTKPHFNQS